LPLSFPRSLPHRILINLIFVVGAGVGAQNAAAQSFCSAMRYALVDVGGYRLNFRLIPGRAPTIVLESGGGAGSSQLSQLQLQLARATGLAVVSYDRAGFGDSDLPSRPYNAMEEVAGLQIGLERLGLAKQVVLVGHSYGGLLSQLYAYKYPKSVKGIVLIDPDTFAFNGSNGPQSPAGAQFSTLAMSSKLQRAATRELRAFDQTLALVRQTSITRSVPTTVITPAKHSWPTRKQNEALSATHAPTVKDDASCSLLTAEKLRSNIPNISMVQPDMVIAAVKALVRKL
jgi:pimeloyl-ACP methyl ester carboxylesterase